MLYTTKCKYIRIRDVFYLHIHRQQFQLVEELVPGFHVKACSASQAPAVGRSWTIARTLKRHIDTLPRLIIVRGRTGRVDTRALWVYIGFGTHHTFFLAQKSPREHGA